MQGTTTDEDFFQVEKICNVMIFIGTNFSVLQLMEDKT